MDQNERHNLVVAGLGVAIVAGGAVSYIHTTLTERKKRKKIEAWKEENVACVMNSRERLVKLIMDPATTSEDFWVAVNEEREFLKIVRNQPMY